MIENEKWIYFLAVVMMQYMIQPWNSILDYWFGKPEATQSYLDQRNKLWFGGDEATDKFIRANFAKDVEAASHGEFKAWEGEPESCLALIVLLDQFSMNMERDTRRCYERSSLALPIAEKAIERGFDKNVHFVKRTFFYLPFEHSESIDDQRKAVGLFKDLILDFPTELHATAKSFHRYAVLHFEVIEKYGRFPGRNDVFGRVSTTEEKKYLDDGGWF